MNEIDRPRQEPALLGALLAIPGAVMPRTCERLPAHGMPGDRGGQD